MEKQAEDVWSCDRQNVGIELERKAKAGSDKAKKTDWVSFMIKLLRAYSGCLGARRRRRTWQAAISLGEPQAGFDPRISEWGNPAR